jgi:titin
LSKTTHSNNAAVSLHWKDNSSNETGFTIERSTDGSSWGAVITVGVGVTSYTDTGRTAGQLYYYRVKAINANGSSTYSNTSTATSG